MPRLGRSRPASNYLHLTRTFAATLPPITGTAAMTLDLTISSSGSEIFSSTAAMTLGLLDSATAAEIFASTAAMTLGLLDAASGGVRGTQRLGANVILAVTDPNDMGVGSEVEIL